MIFLGSTVHNVLVLDSLWNFRSKVCPVLVSWTVQIVECLLSLAEPEIVQNVGRLAPWRSDAAWRGQRRRDKLRDESWVQWGARGALGDGGRRRVTNLQRDAARQETVDFQLSNDDIWVLRELAARKTRSAAPLRGWELWELRGR